MYYRVPRIKYLKPRTLEEAIELLTKIRGSRVLAGGTDLLVDLKTGRVSAEALVDIGAIRELRGVEDLGDRIRIGAATRLQELVESDVVARELPLLRNAVESMGSWQIRNLATVGGNLCNASPAADTAPPLLAYEAELVIVGPRGTRVVPITKFFTGYRRTALEEGEILKEIVIGKRAWSGWSYIKLGRRSSFTLSIGSVAVLTSTRGGVLEDVRIALGSVAPTPIRAYRAEEYLRGREVSLEVLERAAEIAREEASPIDDVRASAWYRREMVYRLTLDALKTSLGWS
jgi:CO/xanthine dehydrogenase FAD-binding subunit